MSVYGYVRLSVARKRKDGTEVGDAENVEVQLRKLNGYAMQEGLVIDHIYQDLNVSAGKRWDERPHGSELLATVKPGDTIIVSKLDRVFRSADEALQRVAKFKRENVKLILIDMGGDVSSNGGNATGKLFFTVLAAMAEFERSRITERIRESKAVASGRGAYLGGAHFWQGLRYLLAEGGKSIMGQRLGPSESATLAAHQLCETLDLDPAFCAEDIERAMIVYAAAQAPAMLALLRDLFGSHMALRALYQPGQAALPVEDRARALLATLDQNGATT